MDSQNRIMYDATRGAWKVLHNGKDTGKEFKTSRDAFQHLESLLHPPPKY